MGLGFGLSLGLSVSLGQGQGLGMGLALCSCLCLYLLCRIRLCLQGLNVCEREWYLPVEEDPGKRDPPTYLPLEKKGVQHRLTPQGNVT